MSAPQLQFDTIQNLVKTVNLGYKYRLYPTDEQKALLNLEPLTTKVARFRNHSVISRH